MADSDWTWRSWPVTWSPIWVGALATLAVGLLIGLLGLIVGAHEASRYVTFKHLRVITMIFEIGGAFFSFVVGGWAAARIAGIRRSEPAMLYGAIVWTLALALMMGLGALGATSHFGGWYAGLAGSPPWASAAIAATDPNTAAAIRNTALATLVAVLLGLIGSVIGGWMASGEPMTLTYYRRRAETAPRDTGARKIA